MGDTQGETQRPSAATWVPAAGEATVTLLLRHGQTPLSVEKRFAGRTDIGLTSHGAAQAAAAAARLAGSGAAVILTSPLRRARDTASAVALATGVPVVVAEEFGEADFGAWDGLTFAEARDRWPEEMAAWLADPAVAPPGGESISAVSGRVLEGLGEALASYRGQTVVIVSHVTPIKVLLAHALLAPLASLYRMHLDVACLSRADWYPDGPAVVRSLNDTGHLRAAEGAENALAAGKHL
ncbi:MAG: histidine phosphatase family protein [Streptosporangiaceae bacterium]|nr:histidine phosphatase family protein [Streptosporangiaceae bacterium]MBV9857543.1 histidine phosphatase family protein [Streptosporangiaceae bacterium]